MARLRERGAVTVAGAKGVTRLRDLDAFLEWLTSPTILRPSSHVWLSPHSAGWDLLATALLAHDYEVRLSRRHGEYLGLHITRPGRGFGVEGDQDGRGWYGGSALDLTDVEPGLSDEDEARATYEQLDELDRAVAGHWPGAQLECSVAATAMRCFKLFVDRPIGLSKTIAADLVDLDAYGGGRIERFCGRGDTFTAAAAFPPWEIDLTSAYPTAMQTVPIPGDFLGYGNDPLEDCTISTVIVHVPERLYPPLRYRVGKSLYYPWGVLLGTWTALELRAAVAAGCAIQQVLRVYRFEDRSDAFEAFALSLHLFRQDATGRLRDFAKGLGVQFVGALGSRPRASRVVTTPEKLSGCRFDRPGLLSERVFEPSERQVLSAAATITGATAAWLGLVLRGAELLGQPAYYVHTDGAGTIDDPRCVLDLCAGLPASLRFPHGHRLVHEPHRPDLRWKVEPLRSARVYAANRRVMVDQHGVERIAAGGISRTLTRAEIEAEIRNDRVHHWTRAGRIECGPGGWTRPYHVTEVDPSAADLAEIIAMQ